MPPPTIKAAIFDVDDTLLNNHPGHNRLGLHERSRLAAVHEVGRRHNIAALTNFTPEQSIQAFRTAKVHSLDAAIWNTLHMTGLVPSQEIEPNHELHQQIMRLKNELHEQILRTDGEEVPGATEFIKKLAAAGLPLAIASTAIRRDIMIFLEITELIPFFPQQRIIAKDNLHHAKPHPEAYNLAFAALGLPNSARRDVLAFEDDPRGVASARGAGLFTCAITTRYPRAELAALETPPDLIADSFAEFEAKLWPAPAPPKPPNPNNLLY